MTRIAFHAVAAAAALALAGCSTVALPTWDPDGAQAQPATPPATAAGLAPAVAGVLPPDNLPPARNWTEYRLRAAERINRANPSLVYPGALPSVFQAIPVLRVQLTADGQVSRVEVAREPGQSPETVKIATDAVYRAAPFGPTSQLPAPAQFTETFLFNEQLRFRLRTTVEGR
ncbi:MAG: hypothetical protein GAK30_00395 [Paracidovorax wautersii]|uniref:TonB family C-terminal domain-containing protein n=1 Tax=Paracidovorax wautersii TaxID=1177982 RepID=A0A7V8FS43_9BURK|nr:MAG: hypothetical protein GAK30_00395 [Paracidovorax wautersii]